MDELEFEVVLQAESMHVIMLWIQGAVQRSCSWFAEKSVMQLDWDAVLVQCTQGVDDTGDLDFKLQMARTMQVGICNP